MAHGNGGFGAIFGSFGDIGFNLLIAIPENLIKPITLLLRVDFHLAVRYCQIFQMNQMRIEPFPIGMCRRVEFLALLIGYNSLTDRINEQHSSGREPRFLHDMLRGYVEHADLR